MSGSVPRGIPSTIYRELLELVSELPVKTILDAEGELLLEGLRGKPDIIKPNLYELETALKTRLNSHRDIVHGARVFIKQGVGIVGVSMGKEGAMIIDDKRAYYAPGMKVDVKGTAGAGDSFVAGLCLAIEEDKDIKDMLRYGVAAATASVIQAGTELCNREDFERLLARVEIEELNI